MLSNARRSLRGSLVLFILVAGLLVAACGAGAALAPAGGAPGASSGPANPIDGGGGTGGEDLDGDGLPDDPDIPQGAPLEGPLIIKNGAIAIQVTGIDAALNGANQQITTLGGYASGSDRSGDGENEQASVTYRVPAARWEEALAGLRGLGEKVLTERSSTTDVTTKVVDLGAEIKNLQATETALQGIMARATEIKDVLTVQAELTKVRGQIETLTAEKTNLEGQAAMSTLTVTFAIKPNPVLTEQQGFDPATEVDQASASLVSVLQGLVTVGIWFAIVWIPILLMLGVVGAVGLWVLKRVARRLDAGAARPPAPEPTAPTGG
ncbi:MAG TPA: DUF4349 domain-containing protein [Candidatus Limnocylindria bacterium]|nr:DUF4349 domain-containing protein [Candidatus Limnocylindria bacterium]